MAKKRSPGSKSAQAKQKSAERKQTQATRKQEGLNKTANHHDSRIGGGGNNTGKKK